MDIFSWCLLRFYELLHRILKQTRIEILIPIIPKKNSEKISFKSKTYFIIEWHDKIIFLSFSVVSENN